MTERMAALFAESATAADYIRAHFDRTAEVLREIPPEPVAELAKAVTEAGAQGKTIFVCGNGGSATVAGAWSNDLSANSVMTGQPGFRVLSLADSGPVLTALGNDISFEEVFAEQLRAWMQPDDLVLGMSCSGNSENVLRAIAYANEHGGRTCAITGFDGGKLLGAAKLSIHIPSSCDEYGPIEDAFSVVMHAVTAYISMSRGRMLKH